MKELIRLEEEARAFGFFWETHQMLHDQITSEAQEVISAIQDQEGRQRVQEEIGDVIHSAIAWCLFAGYDLEYCHTLPPPHIVLNCQDTADVPKGAILEKRPYRRGER